jgi:Porin subfamily
MHIKSFLLCSVGSLASCSVARAANAVIAEPEPVEYVRVCDAYGAGFFYIPGTETCLKISGYVRYDIDFNEDGWAKNTRGQVDFDGRSDTEMGLLRSFIAFQGNTFPGIVDAGIGSTLFSTVDNANVVIIEEAYIQLGGLTVGLAHDYFQAYEIGGENDVLGIAGFNNLNSTSVNLVGYTYAANGINFGMALVDDNDRLFAVLPNFQGSVGSADFKPNLQATFGITVGSTAVQFVAAYDNDTEQYAAKVVVTADVTEGGTFGAAVIHASGETYTWDLSEWSAAASYTQKFSETITASVGAQYFGNIFFISGIDIYSVGANVDWTPATDLLVRAQIQYLDTSDLNASDYFTGRLRFQRSF